MFFLQRPNKSQIAACLDRLKDSNPTYPNPGLTHPDRTRSKEALEPPDTFHVDQHSIILGQGQATFEHASKALFNWKMYETGWTFLEPQIPPKAGNAYTVTAKHFGFYSLNPVQVIYTTQTDTRACFAVGSLPGHVEHGEERFMLELSPAGVTFEILAVSRPASPLVRLAAPLGRRIQEKFFEDAQKLMRIATSP